MATVWTVINGLITLGQALRVLFSKGLIKSVFKVMKEEDEGWSKIVKAYGKAYAENEKSARRFPPRLSELAKERKECLPDTEKRSQ